MAEFETLSVVDVRGERWVFHSARMLGIRDGYLFVEEQTPLSEDAGAEAFVAQDGKQAGMLMSAISKIPLADVTRVNIETTQDDATDVRSTTHQALLQSGTIDARGDVLGG